MVEFEKYTTGSNHIMCECVGCEEFSTHVTRDSRLRGRFVCSNHASEMSSLSDLRRKINALTEKSNPDNDSVTW